MNTAEKAGLDALITSICCAQRSVNYADLTIRCGDRQWKAHKVIVANRSDFFKKAIDGGFEEGTTGVIEIKEEHPDHVERLLQYMYTARYDNVLDSAKEQGEKIAGECTRPYKESTLMTHINMYNMADKFGVASMKELCVQKFLAAAKTFPCNAAFWDAMDAIEDTSPTPNEGLRQIGLNLIYDRSEELTRFTNYRFDEFLRDNPTVGSVLAKRALVDRKELTDTPNFIRQLRFQYYCTRNVMKVVMCLISAIAAYMILCFMYQIAVGHGYV